MGKRKDPNNEKERLAQKRHPGVDFFIVILNGELIVEAWSGIGWGRAQSYVRYHPDVKKRFYEIVDRAAQRAEADAERKWEWIENGLSPARTGPTNSENEK